MPENWPPASAPAWPLIEASDLDLLVKVLRADGWTDEIPTVLERQQFFDNVRCDLGHAAIGRMVVSPDGIRYPFAVCNTNHRESAGVKSRAVFILWPPFYLNYFQD